MTPEADAIRGDRVFDEIAEEYERVRPTYPDELVDRALEAARSTSVPPERMLLDQQAITSEQLSRAIAERYGLDHLDLGIFKVDMSAANLLSAAAAKRKRGRQPE